jgi:hypothetical protein
MPEIADFATLVLILAGGFSVAVLSMRLTERVPVPAPALFLAAAPRPQDPKSVVYVMPSLRPATGVPRLTPMPTTWKRPCRMLPR